MLLDTDRVLSRKYKISSFLGQGAISEAYEAQQLSLKKKVIVKVLLPEVAAQTDILRRFVDEVNSIASLETHPHVIWVLDLDKDGRFIYFVIDHHPHSVAGLLKEKERLSQEEAKKIVLDVLSALRYAHSNGVLHRDIKPTNVLLDESGEAVLTDFGIGEVAREAVRKLKLTRFLPSSIYLAPEQITSSASVDERADIYSVGCLLYEMVTGKKPFEGDVREIYSQKFLGKYERPTELVPDLPLAVEVAIVRAMDKDRNNRFGSALEFAQFLAGESLARGGKAAQVLLEEKRTLPALKTVTFPRQLRTKQGFLISSVECPLLVLAGEEFNFSAVFEGNGLVQVTLSPPEGVNLLDASVQDIHFSEGGVSTINWRGTTGLETIGRKVLRLTAEAVGNPLLERPLAISLFVAPRGENKGE